MYFYIWYSVEGPGWVTLPHSTKRGSQGIKGQCTSAVWCTVTFGTAGRGLDGWHPHCTKRGSPHIKGQCTSAVWCVVTFGTAGKGMDGWHTLTVPNVAALASRASVTVPFDVLLHLVQQGGAWTGDTTIKGHSAKQHIHTLDFCLICHLSGRITAD